MDSTKKLQTSKQIFSEIKNIIHNQVHTTPSKQDMYSSTFNKYCNMPSPVNRNVNQQYETTVFEKNSCANSSFNMSNSRVLDDLELLCYFDFRGQCCKKIQTSKY